MSYVYKIFRNIKAEELTDLLIKNLCVVRFESSTIPASFAIKSNVYFLTDQYLIINNTQSQRALSVSVRTVLWICFASRRNCGLLPTVSQV